MRILVLGAGGIGALFGARLLEAQADVTFAVRPARASALRDRGLVVHFPEGVVRRRAVQIEVTPDIAAVYDLVLLSCKSYDLGSAIDGIRRAVGPHTVVVPMLNGIGHLSVLDEAFGAARVAGGTCHLTALVEPDGSARQVTPKARIAFGPRASTSTRGRASLEALRDLFGKTGVDCRLSPDIQQEMWEKFAFLATFASATCVMRGPIGPIVATETGRRLVLEAFDACGRTAAAAGFPLRPEVARDFTNALTNPESSLTASMFRDLEAGRPTEAEHVISDMRRRMAEIGVRAALIDVADVHMRVYESKQRATR